MIIYKATNKINGKIYIGQTVRTLGARISDHFRSTVGRFPRALRKYGLDNFDFSVVESCESKEVMNERERYWISFFSSNGSEGYNLTEGGENPPSQKGVKRSEETKLKLRGLRNSLGTKRSDEMKNRLAEAMAGNKNSFGHKRSDETKEKMSISAKKRIISTEGRKKLSVAAKARMQFYPMPWEREKKSTVASRATT